MNCRAHVLKLLVCCCSSLCILSDCRAHVLGIKVHVLIWFGSVFPPPVTYTMARFATPYFSAKHGRKLESRRCPACKPYLSFVCKEEYRSIRTWNTLVVPIVLDVTVETLDYTHQTSNYSRQLSLLGITESPHRQLLPLDAQTGKYKTRRRGSTKQEDEQ
jgi:hypothetical protein